jgi:hypothetical protein
MGSKSVFAIFLFFFPVIVFNLSCTKLDTKVHDKVTNFWQTPDQVAAGVAPAYTWLRNFAPTWWGDPNGTVYLLNETSTDEIIVPNRGTDWTSIIWEQMWKHTWSPNHTFVSDGWHFIYGGTARVNSILQVVNEMNPNPVDIKTIQAELKTVRAFYHFMALDLYGNVPISDCDYTDLSKVKTTPRSEVFSFIEKELKDNLQFLSQDVNSYTYGRATQWFAQALLAKLYLNAQVYTGTSKWAECIAACDAILNSNKYSLEPDFFNNFKVANEGSKENIFVIPFDRKAGLDYFMIQGFTLHYNSAATFGIESGGFNGFCSTAEYYNLFEPGDYRRKMFLVGQQYVNQVPDPANLQYDNSGHLLSFDPVITSFKIQDPKSETAGARCAKWEFNKDGWGNMSNDFAVFRLADIILMKAEAQFMNGNVPGALATINQKINGISIHSRANLLDFTAAEMTPDGLLKERACELSWEGWRRNDMIRLGHYLDARIPEKTVSPDYRKLYPIPQTELDKNHYLVQNPGY